MRWWLKNRNVPKRPNSRLQCHKGMPAEIITKEKMNAEKMNKGENECAKNNCCWQTSNGKNRNCHPRIVESEIMAAGSHRLSIFEFGHHTCWSQKPTRGLHAVTGSTGNEALVAASARAVRKFSYFCRIMKVKENLGKAVSKLY
jgi:hypothetical protein